MQLRSSVASIFPGFLSTMLSEEQASRAIEFALKARIIRADAEAETGHEGGAGEARGSTIKVAVSTSTESSDSTRSSFKLAFFCSPVYHTKLS